MDKTPVIELNQVDKIYTTHDVETHALCNINLTVFEGDYLAISGPSGCGKSTLLSIMGLLDEVTKGSYKIAGSETRDLSMDTLAELRNRHIGFIFQSFNLIDELSVFDNVALPLLYREPALTQVEINARVNKALQQVEIDHRATHKPNQLSGGQQQRVAIARALAGTPSILLVDEPTGNLDSKNGDAVMALLSELNKQGTTICMVTHDPRYANYAKKQVRLLDGKIINQVDVAVQQHAVLEPSL
jgi:putative ABC transport system ATP-binding protein